MLQISNLTPLSSRRSVAPAAFIAASPGGLASDGLREPLWRCLMGRPKLDARITIRLPEELLTDLGTAADRRGCSVNEMVLTSLENEIARLLTYRLDYYGQVRPLGAVCQGVVGGQRQPVADMGPDSGGLKKVG